MHVNAHAGAVLGHSMHADAAHEHPRFLSPPPPCLRPRFTHADAAAESCRGGDRLVVGARPDPTGCRACRGPLRGIVLMPLGPPALLSIRSVQDSYCTIVAPAGGAIVIMGQRSGQWSAGHGSVVCWCRQLRHFRVPIGMKTALSGVP